MGMSEGREPENTTNTSCQEEEEGAGGEHIGSGENRGEISEGERQNMSTDCASPIGKSSHTAYVPGPKIIPRHEKDCLIQSYYSNGNCK